jgi:hypothetical protein
MTLETNTVPAYVAVKKAEELLIARHEEPIWCNAVELDIRGRRADFVSVKLGDSGLGWSVGYEIKAQRADFLRELSQPDKRMPLEGLCNETFFVAPDKVIEPDELPEGWGLLRLTLSGLRIVKPAAQRARATINAEALMTYVLRHRIYRDTHKLRASAPVKLFRYAGQELTGAELQAISKEYADEQLKNLKSAARKELEVEVRAEFGKQIEDAKRIVSTASTIAGTWNQDVEIVLERLRAFRRISGAFHRLENLRDQINDILEGEVTS